MAHKARVVIIQNDRIAFIKRQRTDRTYFVFPGGTLESGETLEQAAIREAREETGLEVALESLIARVLYKGNWHAFFVARPIGGTWGDCHGPEFTEERRRTSGTYEPVWLCRKEMGTVSIHPDVMKDVALNGIRHGWPAQVLEFIAN
jgi:8-oxo-dGTP pyrophosphatase MutT (NUDIX family)